ncbi:ABC transporter ATP-binding protein/permease [Haploplasma axanthum]|uniref:ABC transporter ATPase n=1 Tax=Haploplasma axanthum TaxID=29552 RepID=A0A449BDK1_HAPAX|nr:ABC transporter ATP-binding protein/permease [Haploplasma axanthum]VEU80380.1 ABC transporter ATPase [Haploplasma axanthum]
MIKLIDIDKYFNKGKQNSIHVINHTSLDLPKKGLITLLGKSGSGKSTLLNVIGGLDKANGTIIFDDLEIKKYQNSTWDKLRAERIGFIFQNYHLLENKTVYDNLKIVLNMIGINDKEELEYRINYALNAVGMFRYRKKLASDLSGGQKQRVGIARAIVKNPEVIIADEPTGNLDTKNSNDVLRILRKLADEKLVVLVTHEEELAYKYSDRVISLTDGVVSNDVKNNSNLSKSSDDDSNIYLKDLNNINIENTKLYSNDDLSKLDLTIVKIGGTYYLESNENIRVEIIDRKSKIKLVNDSKENYDANNINNHEINFSLDELEKVKTKRTKKRTLTFKESIIEALRKIFRVGNKGKIQLLTLILLGAMFSLSVFMLVSSLTLDKSKLYTDKNLYVIESPSVDMKNLADDENIVLYYDVRSFSWKVYSNAPGAFKSFSITNTALPLDGIQENDLVRGRMPNNQYEILIDETILDKTYSNVIEYNSIGIYKSTDLLNQRIVFNNNQELIIVGTVKTGNKALYINKTILRNLNSLFTYDRIIGNSVAIFDQKKLTEGEMPKKSIDRKTYEVIINKNDFGGSDNSQYQLGDEFIDLNLNQLGNKELKFIVSGFYEEEPSQNYQTSVYLNDDDYYNILYRDHFDIFGSRSDLNIYSIDGTINNQNDYKNKYQDELDSLIKKQKEQIAGSLVQMIIAIALSALMFYFFVRSSFIRRIKELSILRSLGVNKKEVYTLYALEYIIVTSVSSLIGVLIGSLIANSVGRSFLNEVFDIRFTWIGLLVAIIGVYVVNVLLALLPVFGLMRKTPAEMLTNYDI